MTRLFDRPIDSVRGLVRFLAMRLSLISGTKLLEINKHATWIDALYKNATWIEALSVFRLFSTPHFYICHFFVTVLRYLLPPNIPLMQKVKFNCGRKWYKDVKSTRQDVIKSKTQTCPFSHCYLSGSPSFDRGVECLFFLCWLIYLFIYLFIFFYVASLSEHRAPDTQKFSVH